MTNINLANFIFYYDIRQTSLFYFFFSHSLAYINSPLGLGQGGVYVMSNWPDLGSDQHMSNWPDLGQRPERPDQT